MIFKRIAPDHGLEKLIECYWIVENDDPTPCRQKIIPDGYEEIIFHYGDPYRICLSKTWEQQTGRLLAGQITRYFWLENTGRAGVVGIKLKPTASTQLFGLDMHVLTNKVIDLPASIAVQLEPLQQVILQSRDHDHWVARFNEYFFRLMQQTAITHLPVDAAARLILARRGLITVAEIAGAVGLGERQLERLFRKYVGVSPKMYARIIRFSAIFQLIEQEDPGWAGLAYEAGYYDQSHFIRNFKAFTGEDPSRYSFNEKNMANFFLKKKA